MLVALATGYSAPDTHRVEVLERENARLRAQVAALAGSVQRLDDQVFPKPPVRSKEWEGYDQLPQHVFWQRRFAGERRDDGWATAAEAALRRAAEADLGLAHPVTIECRSTACRMETDCAGTPSARQPAPVSPDGGGTGVCLWSLFNREYKGTIDSGLNASALTTVPTGQVVFAIRAGSPPGPPDLVGGRP